MGNEADEGASQPQIHVNYGHEEELLASELQNAWTETMAHGTFKRQNCYKRVSVLMLSWAEEQNNLKGVQDEVKRLSTVFRDRFNFEVTLETIRYSPNSPAPQVLVNKIVAQFVCENDAPNHLLLVYYAGHGKPGDFHGSIVMFSKNRELNSSQEVNELVWNRTESILKEARSDVFQIFDCCHAGNLIFKRGPNRAFEYLAATGADGFTEPPGRESFTSALIYALESLLEEKGHFTTIDLVRRIEGGAPDFPKDQSPVLSDRDENSFVGRITLRAMPKPDAYLLSPTLTTQELQLPAQDGRVLTLHFDLGRPPTRGGVTALGRYFNESLARSTLGVERIRWGGIRPSSFSQVIETFNAVRRRRSRSDAIEQEIIRPSKTSRKRSLDELDAAVTDDSLSPIDNRIPTPKSSRLGSSSDSDDRMPIASHSNRLTTAMSKSAGQSPGANRKRRRGEKGATSNHH